MLNVNLPESLERRLRAVIDENYDGDIRLAITTLLALHEKYGWKEQLLKDVESVRKEERRKGGSTAQRVNEAVQRYRQQHRER